MKTIYMHRRYARHAWRRPCTKVMISEYMFIIESIKHICIGTMYIWNEHECEEKTYQRTSYRLLYAKIPFAKLINWKLWHCVWACRVKIWQTLAMCIRGANLCGACIKCACVRHFRNILTCLWAHVYPFHTNRQYKNIFKILYNHVKVSARKVNTCTLLAVACFLNPLY